MLLDLIYKLLDIPFRIRNATRRKWRNIQLFSAVEDRSDSQVTFYEEAVNKIISSQSSFGRFRRIYDYREILEHVDFRLGEKYLEQAQTRNPKKFATLARLNKNDKYGKPRRFKYPSVGKISPTTLRYIAVAMDLNTIFGSGNQGKIAEIGGGYGGQASILNMLDWFDEYDIYDLPNVQRLIESYLNKVGLENIKFPTLASGNLAKYDLVIANYSFSELPRKIQNEYLEKIIIPTKRGYMLMNSGRENLTGRSEGKITLNELKELIPNLTVLEESPKTSDDNYLVTWGI